MRLIWNYDTAYRRSSIGFYTTHIASGALSTSFPEAEFISNKYSYAKHLPKYELLCNASKGY